MRIKATDEGDETKANTAKIMGNSSYGKLLQNPSKHKDVKLVESDGLFEYIQKFTLNSHKPIETEEGIIYIIHI